MTEKIPAWMVKEWTQEPLEKKVKRSKQIIRNFNKAMKGKIHLSDSGGKDSLVQRHLVRSIFPDTPAVHVAVPRDPLTVAYVKTIDNLEIVIPKKTYKQVIESDGYPVVSKYVSMLIARQRSSMRRGDQGMVNFRLTGNHPDGRKNLWKGVIPQKWRFLIKAPFKISDRCCDIMKKNPLTNYAKRTDTRPFVGTMATESDIRMIRYRQLGCTTLTEGKEQCRPLSHWTDLDVWQYIRTRNLDYSKIYDQGENRTGCIGCMFGCQIEKTPNRFQRLFHRHPKLYNYYINDLGLGKVLSFVGVDYTPIRKLDDFF